MALPDAVENETGRVVTITWTQKGTTTAETLTGFTITGVIEDVEGTNAGTSRAISGTLSVSDGPNGQFTWTYNTTDTGTVGRAKVHFIATSGVTVLKTFPADWVVVEAPTVS